MKKQIILNPDRLLKLLFITSIFCVLSDFCFAKSVPLEKAMNVGRTFLSSIHGNTTRQMVNNEIVLLQIENTETKTRKGKEPLYYIFERANKQGFVIISGDDAAIPILGYSNENSIDIQNMPPNFKEFMEGFKKQILYIKTNKIAATKEINNAWNNISSTRAVVVVPPLLKSTWDQGTYYNALCPGGSYTGCVATAMAQIMRYWNYPNGTWTYQDIQTGTSTHSYDCSPYGTLSATFGTTAYNWAAMPNSVTSSNSAVATLMYQVGVSMNMHYSPSGSGAILLYTAQEPWSAQYSYTKFFKYTSTGLQGLEASAYTSSDWNDKLTTELNNGRPIHYAGGIHSWVMDGYDNANYFHMNWGWGGYSNGYFTLSNLNPSGYNFNSFQEAIIGIQKPSRLTVSSITGPSGICGYRSMQYSVSSNSAFTTYLWKVPAGWYVNGTVSTGAPISLSSNYFYLTAPSSTFSGTGVVSVQGVTSYGETTSPSSLTVSISVGLPGVPQFISPPYQVCQYNSATVNIAPVSDAFGYDWRFTGTPSNGIKITGGGITVNVIGQQLGTYNIYVNSKNSCGNSAEALLYFDVVNCNFMRMVQTDNLEIEKEIVLSPNPARTSFQIDIPNNESAVRIKISNMAGQVIRDFSTNESKAIIQTSDIPAGLYIVNISSDNFDKVSKMQIVK